MGKTIKVTSAQVHAAKLVVERAKETGEDVPEAIRKLARARPKRPRSQTSASVESSSPEQRSRAQDALRARRRAQDALMAGFLTQASRAADLDFAAARKLLDESLQHASGSPHSTNPAVALLQNAGGEHPHQGPPAFHRFPLGKIAGETLLVMVHDNDEIRAMVDDNEFRTGYRMMMLESRIPDYQAWLHAVIRPAAEGESQPELFDPDRVATE